MGGRGTGQELASIVIVCCNGVRYTKECLESVLRHARAPYELVVVDNGSVDGTAEWLEEFRQRCRRRSEEHSPLIPTFSPGGEKGEKGPERVVVVRNEENRGFAAACNQAAAQARGEYLIFLNNDTVVFEGWLEDLIAWSMEDWPKVGLVGPMSNYAPPPQLVATELAPRPEMEAFAAQRRLQFARRALRFDRLSGVCLLTRRDVWVRIGPFDERFGIGFFEDDDLCLKAKEAGYQLLVALNVFIHHYGSRTFAGLGIDAGRQLQENFARFAAKWGPEVAARYRMPCTGGQAADHRQQEEHWRQAASGTQLESQEHGPLISAFSRGREKETAASPTRVCSAKRPAGKRASLTMIVKNEEKNLPACLESVADLVDEIIVVDTGSSDRTREIAGSYGAKVPDFPWIDNFAAARNEALRHATGDWIFWMDADDRLDETNRDRLGQLLARLTGENAAYAMKCRCLPDPVTKTATVVDHIRLFRSRPDVRWQYRVHEQILPALRAAGTELRAVDITIEHVGYQEPSLRERKRQRDLRLLKMDLADNPDEPFTLFNMGWSYLEGGEPREAVSYLQRSLERSHPNDSIVRKLFTLIAECHYQLGRLPSALEVCREGRKYYSEDAQLLYQEAKFCRELGEYAGAESALHELVNGNEGPHFASIADGLRGYMARHLLALVYRDQGKRAEAEAEWKRVLAERPGYEPALWS